MTVERGDLHDYERRSLWLVLAVGLAVILRNPGFVGYAGHKTFQIWTYVASLVAFGLSICLGLLLVIPELRARLGRLRDEGLVFAWAAGLFALGIVITIVAFCQLAIDSL